MIKTLQDLENVKLKGLKSISPDVPKITVGMATCGLATGAEEVYNTIFEEIKKQNLNFIISKTGCIGFCQMEPIVEIYKDNVRIFYKEINKDKAKMIIDDLKNNIVKKEWTLCKISENGDLYPEIPKYSEIPFYKKQQKIALRNCGFINPDSIEEYIARGGYFSLYKALKMEPDEIIELIIKSGLRGRGGAGFLTGLKWKFCRNSKGLIKYIICNADEGDPGAYMDRSVLEGDPHSVIEGMLIGGYAIGANFGYIYVREEYPQAIEKLNIALQKAREYGILGRDIFGSGFNFDIKLNSGAGAFVCGEETALIASVEGRLGEPRPRPPFPAQKGLFDCPTNINNVETWANVPVIIEKGAEWYASIGTEKSKGTKVFSVVGKINNTGLVEVPMGITLKEIIYDIGGGIPNNKRFKAIQTGGPSGGCIPESLLDLPVDYERLQDAGAIMGSGGMIVMDENTCMVDVARYFLDFLKEESCGKCVACREGIDRMLEILNNICEGKGKEGDIELLEELALVVKDFALCALGGTAPNPVLTTIKYFRDEYEKHIKDKKCPAGVCKNLFEYMISKENCNGCGLCISACPAEAISGEKKKPHKIEIKKCIKCGACYEVCKHNAIKIM
jgi:NADH:ubiquinone oxidoreductase subunit F (NADH-binding)/(2Fe-2S) ferredoxin